MTESAMGDEMQGRTMAVIDGHQWYWWQARLCDEYPDDFPKKVYWFLRDDNDHVGYFPTKRGMLAWIKEKGKDWKAGFRRRSAAGG